MKNLARNYMLQIAEQYLEGKKIVCGDHGQTGLYGLYTGYCGIGYQLLRFHDWEKTPSILCLETSMCDNQVLHTF
jgi:lantibiotic modifying enzyme